jgi:hypothetical protein
VSDERDASRQVRETLKKIGEIPHSQWKNAKQRVYAS